MSSCPVEWDWQLLNPKMWVALKMLTSKVEPYTSYGLIEFGLCLTRRWNLWLAKSRVWIPPEIRFVGRWDMACWWCKIAHRILWFSWDTLAVERGWHLFSLWASIHQPSVSKIIICCLAALSWFIGITDFRKFQLSNILKLFSGQIYKTLKKCCV